MAKVETKRTISDALEAINKKYGKGTITSLGSNERAFVKTKRTGSLAIDEALGGGYAVGRIVEMFSEPSCGKSTLALHAIAEEQKIGGKVAYLDPEHAMDKMYAKKIGVDIDDLIFAQPDSAEESLQIIMDLLDTKEISLIQGGGAGGRASRLWRQRPQRRPDRQLLQPRHRHHRSELPAGSGQAARLHVV